MPTGRGKTLCYAIPAIISKGVTIVVTPLLALMDDQVKRLREQKMSVAYINSVMPEEEKDNVLNCLLQESIKYDVLYITPEALLTSQFQKVVERISKAGNLSRIIVDEAHCVDTWGNDFRPSYSSLCTFKEHNIQIVAFTATATEDTAHCIINSLKLVNPNVLRFPLDRPNLTFKVVEKKETKSMVHVSELINNQFSGQCGIIYCFSTRDTLDMAYHLKQRGIKLELITENRGF